MMRNAFTIFSAASVCCLGAVVFISLPPHLKIGGERSNLNSLNTQPAVPRFSRLFADDVAPEVSVAPVSSTNSPQPSRPRPADNPRETSRNAVRTVRSSLAAAPGTLARPPQLMNPVQQSTNTRITPPKSVDSAAAPIPRSAARPRLAPLLPDPPAPPGFSGDSNDATAVSNSVPAETPASINVATSASETSADTEVMSDPEFHEFTEPSDTAPALSAPALRPDAPSDQATEPLFAAVESATDAASESAGARLPDNPFDPNEPDAEPPTTETPSTPDSPASAPSDTDDFTFDAVLSSNVSVPAESPAEISSASPSDTIATPKLTQQTPVDHQPTVGEILVEEPELPSFPDEMDEEDLFASDLSAPELSSADLNASAETITTAPSAAAVPQPHAKESAQTTAVRGEQRAAFHAGDEHDQIEILFDVSELANTPTTLSPSGGNQPTQITASKPQRLSVVEDPLPTLEIPQRITVKTAPGILLPELEFEEWTNCGIPRGGPANGGTLVRPFLAKTVSPSSRPVSRIRGSLEDMFEKLTRVDYSLPGWRRPRGAQPMPHHSGNTATAAATKGPQVVPSRNTGTHAQRPPAPSGNRRMLTSASGKPVAPSGVVQAGWSDEREQQRPALMSSDRRTGAAR